ncbi:MAG: hypothetical protein H8E62_06665 [Planctomycetes bacterium]|nr:hypothetical protein [Planctomycetota bacterium]
MISQRVFRLAIISIYMYAFSGTGLSEALEQEALFSQNTADIFIQQASQVFRQDPLDPQRIEYAMTFLEAALALNEGSSDVPGQILKIAAGSGYGTRDYSERLLWAMDRQVDKQADLELLTGAVRSLLEQQNSRLDREVLLEGLLKKYAPRNEIFGSDLATQLGLLAAEKADMQSAMDKLAYAYQLNRYNRLAFIKLQELSATQELSVTPEVYLLQLRTALDINPYNIDHTLAYAQTLTRMQLYDAAAWAYEYAARLYQFSYPEQPLDEAILLPWILCCYQAPRQEIKCIEITEKHRDPARFDLMLEAVAGKASVKLGQVEKGKEILDAAGKKAEKLLSEKGLMKPIYPEQLAWFYSFVLERPDKALAWANQAYKEAPQRQGVQEIFAYTLAQSDQLELAREYAESSQDSSQIASLTMGLALLTEQDQSRALELLKSAVAMQPESFVAEKALWLLKNQNSDYILPISVTAAEAELKKVYEGHLVPEFIPPQKRFSGKLAFNGSEFFYGNDLLPRLIIENIGTDPLIIGPGSIIEGRLRVDVSLKGDLNVEIPNLLSMEFRPSRPVLPGEHLSISLPLDIGKLRKLLRTYPQANVDVLFTAYLDPVVNENGRVENALKATEPVRGQIRRGGVVLTRDYLMQRLDALSKGQQGQQLRAVKLFAGLLAEQKVFEISQADFQYVKVPQELLLDAVRRALKDENWKIQVQTLDCLISLSMPLDPKLIQDISQNLNHEKWPVRLMAMYLLANTQPQTFQNVLDWTALHDPYPINRRMAIALGAKEQKP